MTTADLMRELQDNRPVAGDELRATVRAIAASEPKRRGSAFSWLGGWRRGLMIAVPAAAALALVTAGVIGFTRSGNSQRVAVPAPVAEDAGTPGWKATPAQGQGGGVTQSLAPASPSLAPSPDRAQRYSATLTLQVPDTDALSTSTQRAQQITRDLGGFVASVSFASAESGSSQLTLRVPTARVQEAIAQLSRLGTIVGQQVQVDDLQGTIDQLTSDIAVLRGRIAHVTALLAGTDLSAERRAALESQRSELQTRLRENRRTRSATTQEARLATIQLTIQTDAKGAVVPVPSRLDRAIHQAIGVLAWEGVIALAAFIVAAPFILLLGGGWLVRHGRRAEHDRLLANS